MAYQEGKYTLYTRNITLRGNRPHTIYFFSPKTPKSGTPCDLPEGFGVKKNPRTGLPCLFRTKPIEPNKQEPEGNETA